MGTAAMITTIMGAAATAITRVLGLIEEGKPAEAKLVVDRFVATTPTQLDGDRKTADEILGDRFPGSQPPEAG